VRAEEATNRFRDRVGSRMRVFFVVPDYFERRPKPCMNGWGSVFLTVTPDGTALPCHAARMLPGLAFPNVRDESVEAIWRRSEGFNRFRGDGWMKEPCRSCPEKTRDFGGCRCQAYMLTGEAENADPVCDLSPHHHVVTEAVERAREPLVETKTILFRDDRNSRRLAGEATKQENV
jgi:PqqA peptide cyclase